MKLTKAKLIKAVRPELEALGYTFLKDSTSGAQGLFGKKIGSDMYLMLGLTIHRFYDNRFTGDFYLSTNTLIYAGWGDIPFMKCCRRPGYLLTEDKLIELTGNGTPDIWWEGLNENSVSSFIEIIRRTEYLMINNENLKEKLRKSLDVCKISDRARKIKHMVWHNADEFCGDYFYLPSKEIDEIPMIWFKATERVLLESNEQINPQIVRMYAIEAYHQYVLDKVYERMNLRAR